LASRRWVNFGSYNATYGSLGAAIGFMTWMWLSTIVVLLGAKVNAELEHQTAKDTTQEANKPMGTRGAEMADSVGPAREDGPCGAVEATPPLP
jgi:membrane protein